MIFEFNNRIDLQRIILKKVNRCKYKYQLSGLTKQTINHWYEINQISDYELKNLLLNISEKLFFLANKSQDQITDDYKVLNEKINNDLLNIEEHLKLTIL